MERGTNSCFIAKRTHQCEITTVSADRVTSYCLGWVYAGPQCTALKQNSLFGMPPTAFARGRQSTSHLLWPGPADDQGPIGSPWFVTQRHQKSRLPLEWKHGQSWGHLFIFLSSAKAATAPAALVTAAKYVHGGKGIRVGCVPGQQLPTLPGTIVMTSGCFPSHQQYFYAYYGYIVVMYICVYST